MKSLVALLVTATVAGGSYVLYKNVKEYKEPVPATVTVSEIQKNETDLNSVSPNGTLEENNAESSSEKTSAVSVPKELNLEMTFYSQAPFGNWDYPWQEACEEASILLVANEYFGHNWTREEFNDSILKIVDWEKEYFGSYEHTDMNQTAEMLQKHLGLDSVVHVNPSFEDLQLMLSKGHFVVAPFAGKELENPFFTNGGPNYHVLVIKGFTADNKIITSDVGTRRGENYVYTWENARDALHDYAEPIQNGTKKVIEVLPPKKN